MPQRRCTSSLSASRFARLGCSAWSAGTLIHGSPRRVTILTPPVVPGRERRRPSGPARRRRRVLQVGDERGRVQRLADRGVVHARGVCSKSGRQVVFGVAPAVGARHLDLAAADRVAQRDAARTARRGRAATRPCSSTTASRQSRGTTPSIGTRSPSVVDAARARALGVAGEQRPARPSPAGRRCCCSGSPAPPAAAAASGGSSRSTRSAAPSVRAARTRGRWPWPRGRARAASPRRRPDTARRGHGRRDARSRPPRGETGCPACP